LPGSVTPVPLYAVDRARGASAPATGGRAAPSLSDGGPLTDREREVVALIVRGCTNREIANELVIAEGTAVRHVANILSKLGLKSRAQVAVWAVERALSSERH
jgi:DNA-binding NarL/FixJ family response regulator